MRALAATASLVVLTGCGTTVSGVGATAPGTIAGDQLAVPSATAPSAASGGAVGPAAGSGSGLGAPSGAVAAGPSAGPGAGGASPAGVAPGAAPTVPTAGRGYDAQHLYLGFPTNNDVNKAAGSGLGATNFGDQPALIRAAVKDVNDHGGILGRTVVPVFHDIKTADLETDPSTQAQATCTAFTQDTKVVAVINIVAAIDLATFYSCLAKHDTPLISAGFVPADDPFFGTYSPYLYKLTAASFTHLAPVWIDRLIAMGYFQGWDTTNGTASNATASIGLLYPAMQPQQRIFADIKSRLTAHGYHVVKEYQYDASSLNAESSSMANAVLQFRNAGVTHILSSESDVLLFMETADSQHYRPRYALTSYHAAAVQFEGVVPASQLAGSMGVGWLPVSDVDQAHNPGPVSTGETACRKVMRDAGQDISSASAAIVALALCDGVHLIAGALDISRNPSSGGLHSGLATLGASFRSALTWRSALSSARADLPGAVRDFRFRGGAFSYDSKSNIAL